jgi:nicotinamide/nicotinate riboside kinase
MSLIAIGGVSRSGKTTLALQIQAQKYPQAIVLHQDEWIQPEALMPMIRDRIDWEHPKSIDWARWKAVILQHLSQNKTVIIEGIFAFADAEINQWITEKHLLKIDEATFRQRKAADKRWGEEPDWYINHIWQSGNAHLNHIFHD